MTGRCNACHRPMLGTTAYDGACDCGGLIEATREHKTMSNASNTDGKYEPKETVIYGYKIELELFEEQGEERSDCSVTKTVNGQEFGGSLGMLMGFGTLEDYRTGDEYVVSDTHQKAIIKWAEDNGY